MIVATSNVLDPDERGRLAGRAVAIVSKEAVSREAAAASVREALASAGLAAAVDSAR